MKIHWLLLVALLALALLVLIPAAAPAAADTVVYPEFVATAERQADGSVLVSVDAPPEAALLCPVVQAPATAPGCSAANPFVVRGDVQVGAGIHIYIFDGEITYLGAATVAAPPYRQVLPAVPVGPSAP